MKKKNNSIYVNFRNGTDDDIVQYLNNQRNINRTQLVKLALRILIKNYGPGDLLESLSNNFEFTKNTTIIPQKQKSKQDKMKEGGKKDYTDQTMDIFKDEGDDYNL